MTLKPVGNLTPSHSSEWNKIWKKPYNSGLAVYRSVAEEIYYLGSEYGVLIFDPTLGTLKRTCNQSDMPKAIPSGLPVPAPTSNALKAAAAKDQSRYLFEYIEVDQMSGDISATPPNSKFYLDLKYLGRFGLVRSDGRGSEVRFVTPETAPEPYWGISKLCGN